jgi:hypothetical protein
MVDCVETDAVPTATVVRRSRVVQLHNYFESTRTFDSSRAIEMEVQEEMATYGRVESVLVIAPPGL